MAPYHVFTYTHFGRSQAAALVTQSYFFLCTVMALILHELSAAWLLFYFICFFRFIYLMYVHDCLECMYMCTPCVSLVPMSIRRGH